MMGTLTVPSALGFEVPQNQDATQPTVLDMYREVLQAGTLDQLSDENLTILASYWGVLGPTERRHLLAEMRGRMARSRTQVQRISIPRGRQYGKVIRKVRKVRQADGSILVETRVVKVTPRPRSGSAGAPVQGAKPLPRVTFGIGFEQRLKDKSNPVITQPPLAPADAPVLKATTPTP